MRDRAFKLLKFADIGAFLVYTGVCFWIASEMDSPRVANPSILWTIYGLFAVTSITAFILASRWESKRHWFSRVAGEDIAPATHALVSWTAIALLIATLVSWALSFSEYSSLLALSPSFASRAITTSLHPLVPLESRLLYTILPLALLLPFARKARLLQATFFFGVVVIGFVTQTKFGLLFLTGFGLYYLSGPFSFYRPTIVRSAIAGVLLACISYAGMVAIGQAGSGEPLLRKSGLLPTLPRDLSATHGLPQQEGTGERLSSLGSEHLPPADGDGGERVFPCADGSAAASGAESTNSMRSANGAAAARNKLLDSAEAGSEDPFLDPSTVRLAESAIASGNRTINSLVHRSFGLAGRVIRLFVCLRQNGWEPRFRGNQIFRVFGGYVPYYRLAFGEFAPNNGSSVNSAVTNSQADAYFNMGIEGVFFAGILTGLIWAALHSFCGVPRFRDIGLYFRFSFVAVLSQGSIVAAVITFLPFACVLFLNALTRSHISGAARLSPRPSSPP